MGSFLDVLIKIDIDSDLYKQIQKLIESGNYGDIYQFIKIAINNQIQEEISEPSIDESLESSSRSIQSSMQESIWQIKNELKQLSGEIPLEKNEIEPEQSDLIWSFYNRLFPVKIIISKLAVMMKPEKPWVELGELQEAAFEVAEMYSEQLKDHEEEAQLSRNQKLSTGLPTPKSELRGLKGAMRRKKEAKLTASKLRFTEQFVGKHVKKQPPSFKGACFEMGLMRVKFSGNSCLVTLSDKGVEFALLENPIIENEKFDSAFSSEETEFIMEKIIPQFKLEFRIVQRILNELKGKNLTSDDIDKIFSDEKTKYYNKKGDVLQTIVQERVSTMGRLSELSLVNWQIDKEGKSVYSLVK